MCVKYAPLWMVVLTASAQQKQMSRPNTPELAVGCMNPSTSIVVESFGIMLLVVTLGLCMTFTVGGTN